MMLHIDQTTHQGRTNGGKKQPWPNMFPADGVVDLVFEKTISQGRYTELPQINPAVCIVQVERDPGRADQTDDDGDEQTPK